VEVSIESSFDRGLEDFQVCLRLKARPWSVLSIHTSSRHINAGTNLFYRASLDGLSFTRIDENGSSYLCYVLVKLARCLLFLHLPAQHDAPNQDNHGYEHVRKLYSNTQTESLVLNEG